MLLPSHPRDQPWFKNLPWPMRLPLPQADKVGAAGRPCSRWENGDPKTEGLADLARARPPCHACLASVRLSSCPILPQVPAQLSRFPVCFNFWSIAGYAGSGTTTSPNPTISATPEYASTACSFSISRPWVPSSCSWHANLERMPDVMNLRLLASRCRCFLKNRALRWLRVPWCRLITAVLV